MMEMIARINELAKKKRESVLTPEEKEEQMLLYKDYLANIRGQLKQQLDSIEFIDEEPTKDLEN